MRQLRKGSPQEEMWEAEDLSIHLKCPLEEAKKIMNDYHKEKKTGRYGAVEKALILDYVEQKQREQREREARFQSDIANAERIAILKEQVKTLKEMCAANSEDARKARFQSLVANIIAIVSLAVAIVALAL